MVPRYLLRSNARINSSVNIIFRQRLWSKIAALGGEGELVDILKEMYKDDTIAIDVNGSTGGLISLGRGVKQGCILSPLLFNIFIADLGDSLNKSNGIPLGSTKVSGDLLVY